VSVNDANTIVHISNLWSGAQYFFSNDYTRTATTPALIQGPYTAPGGNTVSIGKVQDAAELGPDGNPSHGYFAITRTGMSISR